MQVHRRSRAEKIALYTKMSNEYKEPMFEMLKDIEYLPKDYSKKNPLLERIDKATFNSIMPMWVIFEDEEPPAGRAMEYTMKATAIGIASLRYENSNSILSGSEIHLRQIVNIFVESLFNEISLNINNPSFPESRLKDIWGTALVIRESLQINTTIGKIKYLLKAMGRGKKANKEFYSALRAITSEYYEELYEDAEDIIGMLRGAKGGNGAAPKEDLSYFS